MDAKQVPLRELLASVPADARLLIDDADGKGTRSIPVGRLCQEAAAALADGDKLLPTEPVAWIDDSGHPKHISHLQSTTERRLYGSLRPLYAAPPQRKPLTEEEIRDLWSWAMTAEAERTATTQQHAFARAIERAHGIREDR